MGRSTISWEQFGKLKDFRSVEEYLLGREYGHGEYCHYTRLSVINSILSNQEFWLSNVNGFNDKKDKEHFAEPRSRYYSLCFSTGVNENLSLWYLYAGMDGQGGRLRLTKNCVKKLIETGAYALYEIKEDKTGAKEKVRKVADLIPSENMRLTFRDILYYKEAANGGVDLKYNTMTNRDFPSNEFATYRSQYSGFCKGLIWYYEKETRLLIELTGSALNQLENGKKYIVTLRFHDAIYRQIKLDFAPEIENIESTMSQYCGIKKFTIDTSHTKLSKYAGTLKMDLCKKCDKRKNDGSAQD